MLVHSVRDDNLQPAGSRDETEYHGGEFGGIELFTSQQLGGRENKGRG